MNLKIHILLITIASTITCSDNSKKLLCYNEINDLNTNNNQIITTLNLDHHYIGAEGALYLSDTLMINNTLQILYLGFNNIGDEAVQHLADVLKINTTLNSLYLNSNIIGAEGTQHFSDALK